MTPQLRFPEFTDEWQVKKLGDVVEFKNGKPFEDYVSEDGEYYLITIDSIDINGNLKSKFKRVTKSDSSLQKDDIVTVLSDIAHGELLGLTSLIPNDSKFVLNQRMGRLRPKGNDLPNFLSHYINTSQIYYRKRGQGTSQRHIYERDINQMPVNIPSVDEQEKIAEFLTAVDKRIAAGEKKLELLQKYKKGVMQKIFTQQIRFKDENGNPYPEWEEKRLGDIFQERNSSSKEGARMLSVTINNGVIPFDESVRKDNSNSDKSKYKSVEVDDIAYNSMRMWQGASGVSKYIGIVSPAYTVVTANKNNNAYFWSYYFKLTKVIQTFERHSQGLTSDTWNLKYKAFSKIKVKEPRLEEQQKIATFLTALDAKITAEQTHLTAAKQWKKGLLQRMFV